MAKKFHVRYAIYTYVQHEPSVRQLNLISYYKEYRKELGISLTQTINERHRCEVKRLATWCLEQKGVISLIGEFDPDRVILHDTSCTLTLAVKDPKLQARPDRCNPQSKLDIAEMVRNNLRQGIIEKSNASWSSNCVVIRKDGKTRIAVDYRKLNEVTVRTTTCYQRSKRSMRP